MWLTFNTSEGTGFASIVAKDVDGAPSTADENGELSMRFRRQQDAYKLFGDDVDVIHTPDGDYAFRVFITRAELAEVLTANVMAMTYTNFKAAIPESDFEMSDTLHEAWQVYGDLQVGGPCGEQTQLMWGAPLPTK